VRRAGALALLLLAGCGGANTGYYAGMDQYEARQTAMNGMAQETNNPNSPLYKHPLLFKKIYQGTASDGNPAWVAMFGSSGGERACFHVRATKVAFGSSYYTEVDRCESEPRNGTTQTGNPA
jgi:hypothetical protein